MKLYRVLLLIPAILALLAAAGRADEPKIDGPKKVPFELLKSGHMAVEVKVNGKGPYRLVFDTGAPMMLVNNKLAKEAGVIKKDAKAPGGINIFGMMGQSTIKDFEMGELKAENVTTMVMDHPTVAQMSQYFGRIDGIVGFPFFARYRMTIDYQAKEMSFEPTDFKPTNIIEALMNMMMNPPRERNLPKVLAPAAQWGLVADKGTQDDKDGLDVTEIFDESPAAKAGLKTGDRLLTLDGRWTDTVVDLFEAASHVKPGKTVPVVVLRDGKKVELKVTPAKGL